MKKYGLLKIRYLNYNSHNFVVDEFLEKKIYDKSTKRQF